MMPNLEAKVYKIQKLEDGNVDTKDQDNAEKEGEDLPGHEQKERGKFLIRYKSIVQYLTRVW